jgi:hypothetical protein
MAVKYLGTKIARDWRLRRVIHHVLLCEKLPKS